MNVRWRAIAWGIYYMIGMVIVLKLFEGMIFSNLPYDSRGVGRFISHQEIEVQGYTQVMLLGYLLVHTLKIAIPSYLAAQISQQNCFFHASLVVIIATLFNWGLFQAIVLSPISELVGLAYSLLVSYIAARAYEARQYTS